MMTFHVGELKSAMLASSVSSSSHPIGILYVTLAFSAGDDAKRDGLGFMILRATYEEEMTC